MWARLVCARSRVWQAPEWPAFVGRDWQRHLLHADLTDRLHRKQGRSIARWTLTTANGEISVFVKRHYRHCLWTLLSPLGRSDADREWHHLQKAGALGVPVPRPLALAEWSRWPGRLQSALVLEELAGMMPLHEAIPLACKTLTRPEFKRWKRNMIMELVRLTKRLHDRGYFHRDLYLCHFFLPSELIAAGADVAGRLVLIDFHRLTRQRMLPLLGRAKDLAQLLYSSRLPGVRRRDVLLFWRLYAGDRRRPVLRRLVEWKARRYWAHNRKSAA